MTLTAARLLILVACCLAVPGGVLVADVDRPRIALIIDDLGYELEAGRRTVSLPGPVACAVLPATPRGRQLAELAAASGKEVLLHLPLQAQNHRGPADPGALLLDMNRQQFAEVFAENLASVPHAIGVNNHRGSLLTRHPGHMRWLMEELGARGDLFFVDSYTTHRSVALQLAEEAGIPAARRDVFLDAERSVTGIAAEFERLKRRARRYGSAVGIGHPYPETLAYLEEALPALEQEGFRLVSLRELLGGMAGD